MANGSYRSRFHTRLRVAREPSRWWSFGDSILDLPNVTRCPRAWRTTSAQRDRAGAMDRGNPSELPIQNNRAQEEGSRDLIVGDVVKFQSASGGVAHDRFRPGCC